MQTIYLEPDEEITQVIEKLSSSKEGQIKFVVPKGATLLQSLVNLKLLKKRADALDKEIFLVTSDKIGRNLASQVGISVFSEGGKEITDKSRVRELEEIPTVPGVRIHRYYLPKEEASAENLAASVDTSTEETPPRKIEKEEKEVGKEEREPSEIKALKEEKGMVLGGAHLGKRRKIIFLALALGFLVALAGFAYVFGPRAEALIYVQSEPYTFDLTIEARSDQKDYDLENAKMPLQILVLEKSLSQEFPATGKKEVGEKAKGNIIIYNSWDQNPQTLVAGTRFIAEGSDKVFRTLSDVTVPGATLSLREGQINVSPSSATVAVEADAPGDAYNIGPSKFTIPGLPEEKQKKIYGESKSAMTGGTSKEVTILSDKDINEARKILREKAALAAKEELAGGSDKLILENVEESEIVDEKFSAKAGAETEKFKAELTVKESLLAISTKEFRAFVERLAQKNAPEGKNLVLKMEGELKPKTTEASLKEGWAKLTITLQSLVYAKIDKERIQTDLVGKNKEQARAVLASQPADRIEIRLTPSFLKRLPLRKEQIRVVVKSL
jgi:hypothetical protein